MASSITTQTAREFLQKGELDTVAQILHAYPIRNQRLDDIRTMILAQFSRLSEANLLGEIDYEKTRIETNRIIRKF